jgi:hypothetical protein
MERMETYLTFSTLRLCGPSSAEDEDVEENRCEEVVKKLKRNGWNGWKG